MHQLIEDVLPYFVALYVLDSLALVRAHELLFVRPWRRFALLREGWSLCGLAPQAEVLCALELPVRLGPELLGWPQDGAWVSVPWTALGPIGVEQRSVRCQAGQLEAPSPEAARHIAELLAALRDEPAASRWAKALALADAAADVEAVRSVRRAHERHAGLAAALGWILLIGLFGLLPAAVLAHGSGPRDALVLLGALAPVYALQVALAWRTLRACGVGAGPAASALASLAFFPPTAAHVRSLMGRSLYLRFDPLALAAVVLPHEAFCAQARERHHRARLELQAQPEFAAHAELRERVWRRVVALLGLQQSDVLRAPRSQDDGAASYCPLCSAEYRAGFETCSDCQAPLEPLLA